MRIQHNIMAMNAYRNYTNNVSAMKKNLEKLSSGYKINRAGDDAAGLAISEKMRAQITGLKQAQNNAKSGINLVQTAEGALQEVHDMLNRMVKLADQSANGTYDDTVDRVQLQKEVSQLQDEINRIADSANFNGIKLLDGSLSSTGKTSSADFGGWDSIKGALAAGITDVKATKSKSVINMAQIAASTNAVAGDKLTMSISMSDGKKYDFEITAKADANDAAKYNFVDKDGNELLDAAVNLSKGLTDANIGAAFEKLIKNSDLGKTFDVKYASSQMTLEAKTAGAGPATVDSTDMTYTTGGALTAFTGTRTIAGPDKTAEVVGADAYQALDLSKALVLDHKTDKTSLEKAVFEINGEKFVFVEKGQVTDDNIAKMKEAGIEHWVELAASTTGAGKGPTATDIAEMVKKIKHSTGLDVKQGKVTTGAWTDAAATPTDETFIKISNGASTKEGGGLVLQIGDTSDSFNQLRVSIKDMHAKSLGIASVDISNQDGAAAAVDVIKNAINTVSDIRGTLGATQNRLDHTINNLSVMEENIQDAESTIRDTDVAEEMMAYTKNNILIQSAQAMLAQANQVPQGVLQLLQ